MSELAFSANGEVFEVPANVTAWRVRRMKPRGAPELVYGADGRPLTVPIEATIDDLREAVGSAGKYRLDPINDDGKCVESVPPAYVQVVRQARNAEPTIASATAPSDDTLREAMRLNTELARSVIDRFPEMMTAAAELLRAADGAGIPRRAPREVEDADDDEYESEAPTGLDLSALIAQVVPVLMSCLVGGKMKMPDLSGVLDWRKAAPSASPQLATEDTGRLEPSDGVPENAMDVLPPIDTEAMAHFVAVQSALTPEESAIAREVASSLSAGQLRTWFDELRKLSVAEAVQKIRALIAGQKAAVS